MQTNKTLIFDKNADNIFKKGDYVNSYMVIDLKSVNLDFQIEQPNSNIQNYNLIATLTDMNNNPIPNNIVEFYKDIDENGCTISVSSNKNIIPVNKVCILTASVEKNNTPLNNILVQFYRIDDDENKLIGESITDENGQAFFEYIGIGANETTIIAKCGEVVSNDVNINDYNPIITTFDLNANKNTIQINENATLIATVLDNYGQPYDNIDINFIQKNKQLFKYVGTSGVTEKNNFVSQTGSNAVGVTVGANGTTLAPSSTSTGFIWAKKSTSNINVGDYYCDEQIVEFDVVALTGQPRFGFYESYGIPSSTSASVYLSQTGHIKAVRQGTVIKYYVDGVLKNTYTDKVLREPLRLGFVLPQGTSLTFKNFSIIGDEPVYPVAFHDEELRTVNPTTSTTTVHDWNIHDIDMSDDCIIEWDMKTSNYGYAVLISNTFQANNNFFGVGVSTDNTIRGYYKTTTSSNINISSIWDYNSWHYCKLTKIGDNLAFVVDGVLIGTKSLANWTGLDSMQIFGDTWASGITCEAKNFVVKSMEEITTDVNGIATCNFIGDGGGEETYYAKANNSISNNINILDGIMYAPKLDGTENITSWSSLTNKTEDGIFYSHGSFLTDGWSNEGLWELEFECMCTTSNWKYIGVMPICMSEINPYTDAKRNNYALTTWEGFTYPSGFGTSPSYTNGGSFTKLKAANTWYKMKITKTSNTTLQITLNDTYTDILTNLNNLPNATTLHIGTRDNPASRNSGDIIRFRNIVVKSIG